MSVCVSNCPAAATMSMYVYVNADVTMGPSQLTCDTADDSDDQDDGRPHHSAGSQSLSQKVDTLLLSLVLYTLPLSLSLPAG